MPTVLQRPKSATYEASAPFDDPASAPSVVGGSGRAKIYVGRQTVGRRLWRFVCQTFNFEL